MKPFTIIVIIECSGEPFNQLNQDFRHSQCFFIKLEEIFVPYSTYGDVLVGEILGMRLVFFSQRYICTDLRIYNFKF